jgi:predicted Ser/Thr protein kinase
LSDTLPSTSAPTWTGPALDVPPTLNHFRVDRELARGGMGAVYLGHDTSLDRPVALKVILPGLASQQSFTERFLREARAQARITHSNVVQVFYVGEENGMLYMAMELVDGGSLEKRAKQLSWEDALKHMRGLAEGLREAARLGIVHKDIKPSNVLLDRFGLAHLADFGLAAPVRSADAAAPAMPAAGPTTSGSLPSFTRVGEVMGSPPYMSPEQAKGQPLDQRSDIYSLGAAFYELMTGRLPNQATTLKELLAFFESPLPTAVSLCPDIPRRFARIIDRCMERDLSKRFQDWDEVIAALDKAKPRPVIAAPARTRVMAWIIDVAPFAFMAPILGGEMAVYGFLLLPFAYLIGALWLSASPGQWMMRLRTRVPPDLRPGFVRMFVRGTVQHGWTAPAAYLLNAIYTSASQTQTLVVAIIAALLFVPGVLGSVAFFFTRERRTLVDLLSGTRVLLDVR